MSTLLVAATCGAPLPHGPAVPAPIVFKTGCGGFRLETSGAVTRFPRGWIAARLGDNPRRRFGSGLKVRRNRAGRITLLRGDRVVWRSQALYPNTGGDIAFGPGTFAFASYYRGVFLTDLEGPERLVVPGRARFPHDFFDSGRLIVSAGQTISVLSPRGRVERRYVYDRQGGYTFDGATNTLYFVTPGKRVVTVRESQLRVARRVRSDGSIWLATPERLLFSGARSLTLTDLAGRLIARAGWPRAGRAVMDSGATVSPKGRHVAFRLSDPKKRRAVVYVLAAGEMQARPVYSHRLNYVGCGDAALMSWHDGHLLYRSADGHVAVVDAGSRSRLDLTRLARALPHGLVTNQTQVAWASAYGAT